MILELIFNGIKATILFIVGLLPKLEMLQLPTGAVAWFTNLFSNSAYFLPLTDFLVMFGIFIVVTNFEIIWKFIQRVYDAIPFV